MNKVQQQGPGALKLDDIKCARKYINRLLIGDDGQKLGDTIAYPAQGLYDRWKAEGCHSGYLKSLSAEDEFEEDE